MRFRLLGPVTAVADGEPVAVGRRRERLLLAVLLLEAGRPVSVRRLAELLWTGESVRSPRDAIYVYVSRLRRCLRAGGVELASTPAGYAVLVDPETVDAHQFTRLTRQARETADPAERAELLDTALRLWRGPALADVASDELRAQLCARLAEQRIAAQESRAEAYLDLGRHDELVAELAELTRAHPTRERLVAARMLALHRAGRQTEALEVFRQAVGTLADELGLDPAPRLVRLHTAILRNDPELSLVPPGVRPAPAAPRPAQLPGDLATFTGRAAELEALLALHPDGTDPPPTVVLGSIDGMAGVGKTALAVHAAHRLADRFPDGQLFVNLHGSTRGMDPVAPADALDRMLRSVGVPGVRIPHTLEERAALWRTSIAGRRMIVVLDNALDESQVRPLLPGATGSLVLVTSRRRLTGLDDAAPVSLDVLPVADATAMFRRIAGVDRLGAAPAELIDEIVARCGRLPLAIRLAAARLRHRPTWTPGHLADRLRDRERRLAELECGQRGVTAALDVSYRLLEPDQQRMFRLLGRHPGPDFDFHAAAALAGTTAYRAERLLDDLLDVHLVAQPQPNRYQLHDLVRTHAAHVCAELESEAERHRAATRLFDHYAGTATVAMDLLYPHETGARPRPPESGVPVPELDGEPAAAAWLDVELTNLLAVAQCGGPAAAVRLSALLHRHLRTRGRYSNAETLHTCALRAARQSGDRVAEADILTRLGHVHRMQERYDAAIDCLRQAVELAGRTGHRAGEHDALWGLGQVHRLQGRYGPAIDCFRLALSIARAVGDGAGELNALTGLGAAYRAQSAHARAIDCLQDALAIARTLGDRAGEHNALRGIGSVHRMQGRFDLAIDCNKQALAIARSTGHRVGELNALGSLGHAYRLDDRYDAATGCYREALDLAQQLGHRNSEFEALYGLGQVDLSIGRADRALAHHRRALDLARELGQAPDQSRAHDGLARACHALGQRDLARRNWQQTLAILADLGLTRIEEIDVAEIQSRLTDLDRHEAAGRHR
ncbi:MAG TPA: tetratricopeptide repeat protein [Actinophytocola sp.]|uniref:AfsR/SARP family transcriptional regulator n=1 Tax=Actinophytocola sp. TaxID=1872138 RepID=UPI002DBE0DB7|nr:tetratricopeptide repeat protein [Actinophytocola sp.]HEU5475625.1 tetratricopeptide repeat protein [Actinophytocola sp.]